MERDLSVLGSKKANAIRWHHPESELIGIEAEIRAARILRFAKKQMADAPPLTDDQIAVIARILGGGE